MPTRIDTLYADLELRTAGFEAATRQADQRLAALDRSLSRQLPNASAVAARALTRDGQELSRKIDRIIYKYEELAKAVDRSNTKELTALQDRARRAQENIRVMGANVEQTKGMAAVLTDLQTRTVDTTAAVSGMGTKGAAATRALASGFETMARAGGDSMASLKGGVSSLASLLGTGGVLATAVLFATTAVVEMFQRAREEAAATARALRTELLGIRRSTDLGGLELERRRVGFGDSTLTAANVADARKEGGQAAADQLEAERRGVVALRRELDQLNAATKERSLRLMEVRVGLGPTITETEALNRANAEDERSKARIAQLLALLEPKYQALTKRVKELAIAEGERQALELRTRAGSAPSAPDEVVAGVAAERASRVLDQLRANRAALDAFLQDQAVAATRSLVDDLLLELGRFEAKLRADGFTEDQIALFSAPRRQALALQEQIETLTTRSLPALSETLKQSLRELNASVAPAVQDNPFDFSEVLEQQQAARRHALELGRAIEMSARAGLQLAEAFGIVDENVARSLQGAVQLASALPGVMMGDPASIVSAIGGVASFLRRDPERARQHQENLEALRQIERHTGDLANAASTGSNLARARTGAEVFRDRLNELSGQRARTLALVSEDAIAKAAGLTVAQLRAIAAEVGVVLDGTRDSVLAFLEALKKADLAPFADTLQSQLDRLALLRKLDPAAFEGLKGVAKELELIASRSPAVRAAFEGIDLTGPNGPAKALEALRDLFQRFDAGELSAEQIGISVADLREYIARLAEELTSAVPRVKTKLEEFASAFALLQESFDVRGLDAAQRVRELAALFAATFEEFQGLTSGEGLSLDAVRARFQQVFEQAARDGTIDEGERAILDAFRQLLAALQSEVDAATTAAEAEANRRRATQEAEDEARRDVRVRTLRAQGLDAEADALERQIRNEAELNALRLSGVDEAIVAQLAFVQALEESRRAALAAADAAREAAQAERERTDFLQALIIQSFRDAGNDLAAELTAIAADFEEKRKRARDLGLGAEVFAQIDASEAAAIARARAAAAGETAGGSGGGGGSAAGQAGGQSGIVSAATALTERTGNRMADYLGTGLILDRARNALLEQIRDRLGAFAPVVPPVMPTGFGAPPGVVLAPGGAQGMASVVVERIEIKLPEGSVTPGSLSLSSLGREELRRFARQIGALIAQDMADDRRRRGAVVSLS